MKVKFFSSGVGDQRIAFKVGENGVKSITLFQQDEGMPIEHAEIETKLPKEDTLSGKIMVTIVMVGDVYSFVA